MSKLDNSQLGHQDRGSRPHSAVALGDREAEFAQSVHHSFSLKARSFVSTIVMRHRPEELGVVAQP